MLITYLNYILFSALLFTPKCSIEEYDNRILSICKESNKEFALEISLNNYKNLRYGQWNKEFVGHGHYLNIIKDKSNPFCGYYNIDRIFNNEIIVDYDASYTKNNSEIINNEVILNSNGYNFTYDDSNYLYIGNYLNGKLNGLGASFFWNYHIGFYQDDKYHGEGIYYSYVEEELFKGVYEKGKLIHGIWKNGKLVKIFKVIDISELSTSEPDCGKVSE